MVADNELKLYIKQLDQSKFHHFSNNRNINENLAPLQARGLSCQVCSNCIESNIIKDRIFTECMCHKFHIRLTKQKKRN